MVKPKIKRRYDDDHDVSFYNSVASRWTLVTPRTTWEYVGITSVYASLMPATGSARRTTRNKIQVQSRKHARVTDQSFIIIRLDNLRYIRNFVAGKSNAHCTS